MKTHCLCPRRCGPFRAAVRALPWPRVLSKGVNPSGLERRSHPVDVVNGLGNVRGRMHSADQSGPRITAGPSHGVEVYFRRTPAGAPHTP